MAANQQPIQNDINLSVTYRTNRVVHLHWDEQDNLTNYPYSLWYVQIGVAQQTQLTQVPLPNLFCTQQDLELPGGHQEVLFVPGNEYRFVLNAQPRGDGSRCLNGIAEVKLPEAACHGSIQDILDDGIFVKKLCVHMDPKVQLRKVVAFAFGISREVYDHVEFYKNPETHPVTEQLIQRIVELNANGVNDRLKVCNLLRVAKEHGTRKVLQVIFQWHMGRGPCAVCTRDLFDT